MSHRPTGAAAAREVLLFVGKARTSSSAPPFSWTSSRNASAGRSSPNGRPPSLTVALAQIGRHPSERPHATSARVAQIVARLSRRTDQIPVPCAAYTGQHRRPATPLEHFVVGHCDCGCPSVYLPRTPMLHLPLARAAYSIGAGRRFARGFDRDSRALPELVAAACQVGGLGGVARQFDGLVVRRARLLTAAQPAQQVGAGRMVGVIAGQLVLKTADGRRPPVPRA